MIVACIIASFFLLMTYYIYCMDRACFIFSHSSVNGHLYCFHFFTFMNNVAMNFPVEVLLWTHVLVYSERMSMSQIIMLLNINLYKLFKRLPSYFPKWIHYFTFLSANYKDFNFCTFLPIVIIVYLFDYSHPSGYEVASPCGFNLHFPND